MLAWTILFIFLSPDDPNRLYCRIQEQGYHLNSCPWLQLLFERGLYSRAALRFVGRPQNFFSYYCNHPPSIHRGSNQYRLSQAWQPHHYPHLLCAHQQDSHELVPKVSWPGEIFYEILIENFWSTGVRGWQWCECEDKRIILKGMHQVDLLLQCGSYLQIMPWMCGPYSRVALKCDSMVFEIDYNGDGKSGTWLRRMFLCSKNSISKGKVDYAEVVDDSGGDYIGSQLYVGHF